MTDRYPEEGFTLIELMIVVAIIGILAAIGVARFESYRTKSLNTVAQSDLRNAMASEEAYYAENSGYFSLSLSGTSGGVRNSTLNVSVSENVTLNLTSSITDYVGTSRHAAGTKTYTVTGSVGVIR